MPQLSQRETEVAQLAASGLTNRQIGERLFVSERTAEYHLEQIRNKLGLHSRAEIATWLASQAQPKHASHLPLHLTTFIGRAREIAAVRSLLDHTRMVTIIGAGGTGKTRLALEVADRLADRHPDGVWFVDLAGVRDLMIVAGQAASALGVQDLKAELAARRQLVVLDNCEQVATAAAELAHMLLNCCSGIKVLATSRRPLQVAGEGVWSLQPLSVTEAVNLFVERARLAAPDVDLEAAEPEQVISICRDLDGIPLAIELAASRTRVMSLADLREHLRDRFRLLTGGTGRPERQRTLEATIDWSYGLLTEEDRLLFARLGIFAGSFLMDSAQMVVADARVPAPAVPDLINGLIEQSMVIAERAPDRATRYRLLITLREYARNRLRELGEVDEMRRRHARRFRELAEQAGPSLEGPDQQRWMQRLEDELDEIRAASEWALDADPETALALAERLGWLWGLRGRVTEGRRALAAALARAPARTVSRGRGLVFAGWLARLQGDALAGTKFHAESVEVLREFDDPVQLGAALVWNGEAISAVHGWDAAERAWKEAVDLLEPLGPSQPLAYAMLELAIVDVRRGDADSAAARANLALAMNSQLHNLRAVALSQVMLGYARHLRGDSVGGLSDVLEGLRQMRDAGAIGDVMWPLEAASTITITAGGSEARAVTLAGAAEMASAAAGREPGISPFPPEGLEAALSAAQAKLGPSAYEEAWEKGLAMTVDEVLAFALDSVTM